MKELDSLDGFEFEEFVARVFSKRGYEDVEVKEATSDKGKDIVMNKGTVRYVVECKHQESVGRPVVQKLQGAMAHENQSYQTVEGVVVTSGYFSKPAKTYAEKFGIKLIDGRELTKICKEEGINVVNGKIQVTSTTCLRRPRKQDVQNSVIDVLENVRGYDETIRVETKYETEYYPSAIYEYTINTSYEGAGKIVKMIAEEGTTIIDGVTGRNSRELEPLLQERGKTVEKEGYEELTQYKLSEEELDENATNTLIQKYAEVITYTGKNNVTYQKQRKPSPNEIYFDNKLYLYHPRVQGKAVVQQATYSFETAWNGAKKYMYLKEEYGKYATGTRLSLLCLCKKTGKILDRWNVSQIENKDGFVSRDDAHRLQLYLRTAYFIDREERDTYEEVWEDLSVFQKLWRDKYLLLLLLTLTTITLLLLFL